MSGHDCSKCYLPIKKGQEKEAFELLYHEGCVPPSEPREFMVLITCGPHKACWVFDDKATVECAVRELEGIVEAGGNVWDTEGGEAPYELSSLGYETILAMDVTGLSEQERQDLETAAEVMSA
jgi:hypothetical protein